MTDQYIIETAGLTKVFRDFWGHSRVEAVKDLDLQVRPGEVFGLLGPNGSGKSTTIKMLLGLLFPTRGLAKVLGRPPGDVQMNRRIGYLPEESHFYPFLNARETLHFYGRLFNLPGSERRERIDSLLEMVGLASVGRRTVGQFSKGMQRRIGLAQALINDPDLLILDEPTSGLDPIGTRQIKDLISELGRRGKTVLLCSHLLPDVEDVCDRVCVLYGGKVRAQGVVEELLAQGDQTQIRTPHVSEAALERIRQILQEECDPGEIQVDHPRVRLEEYFLEIVAKAQATQEETSGVLIGSGVSDFLSGPAQEAQPGGRTVIEDLVARPEPTAAETPQEKIEVVPVETPEPVRCDVLDNLVTTGTSSVTSDEPEKEPEAVSDIEVPSEEKVDRSVLDALVNKEDKVDDADGGKPQ